MRIIALEPLKVQPMALTPVPYTAESIAAAKAFQEQERIKAAREMGIPQDLIDFYEVYGFEQVVVWTRLIEGLKS